MADDAERAPLLQGQSKAKEFQPSSPSRIWRQAAGLLATTFAIPLSLEIVFPFVSQMILENGIACTSEQVGFYSGVVESVFSVMSLIAIIPCTYLADSIGRKPIIVVGNIGLAISVICFGFSKTFVGMILSRCIAGTLGATWSVSKIMMAEISDKSNESALFTVYQLAYRTGQIVGLPMGGLLTHPARHYALFKAEFWIAYPFALPCIVAAVVALISALLCFITLPETLPAKTKGVTFSELSEDQPIPAMPTSKTSFRAIFTPSIISLLCSTFAMFLTTEALVAVYPLFAFTPIQSGGLGLDEATIGIHMGFRAVLAIGILPTFSILQRRLGAHRVYQLVMMTPPLVFIGFPLLNMLARHGMGNSWVFYLALFTMFIVWSSNGFAWIANAMMINDAAPDAQTLSAINAASQIATILPQAIAPISITSLFAISIESNVAGGNMVWVAMFALNCVVAIHSYTLRKPSTSWRQQD
ncbi:hypothetical protein BOTBODRAFT_33279 [Botryobasidium botryosum FD-172 SS1]|uniref:Major facilitator superfamily (MFS) profile domain-containing protein n=1 Tax=Botryobasidium botryosum (strain FD-172 SS1) TaxID=930990 RepID=A0A067MQJ6_BOTB1|nr:hypothetical protein BOTBODRAFT_33279 [Botryobasidium botryosum FD-172 SS1]